MTTLRRTFASGVLLCCAVSGSGCGGGGGAEGPPVFGGNSSESTVPVDLFPGQETRKPAALLMFTAEISALAISADGRRLFAADRLHSSVSVMDTASARVLRILATGAGPRAVTLTPDDQWLLVANFGTRRLPDERITLVDLTDPGLATAHLEVGPRPFAIAVSADGRRAYVALSGATPNDTRIAFGSQIAIVDLLPGVDLDALPVRRLDLILGQETALRPVALALSPDQGSLYVLAQTSDPDDLDAGGRLVVVDTASETVSAMASLGQRPSGLLVHPVSGRIYVSNSASDTVTVHEAGSGLELARLSTGPGPLGLALHPAGDRLFVANAFNAGGVDSEDACGEDPLNRFGASLSLIDTDADSVLATDIAVGPAPLAMVITRSADKLYVIAACEPNLYRLSGAAELGAGAIADALPLAARSLALALAPDRNRLYLAHPDRIGVLDTGSDRLLAPIPVRGAGPQRLALSADGTRLYATHPGADAVSVTDPAGGRQTARIAVGLRPAALAFGADGRDLYVANAGFSRSPDDRVSIVDTAGEQLAGTLTVGRGPVDLAAGGTRLYVAAFGDFHDDDRNPDDRVSIVDTASRSVVAEARGGAWNLRLAAARDGTQAFVSRYVDSELGRIDANGDDRFIEPLIGLPGPLDLLSAGDAPSLLAVAGLEPAEVAGRAAARLALIDLAGTALAVSRFSLVTDSGPSPAALRFSPGGDLLVVVHAGDRAFECDGVPCTTGDRVSLLPVRGGPAVSIAVGRQPSALAFAQGLAFVSNFLDDSVSVIDLAAGTAVGDPIPVGAGPLDLAVAPDESLVYVANSLADTLTAIEVAGLRALAPPIAVGSAP